MKKLCLICHTEFKTGDVVISPMTARIVMKEDKYDLEVFQQIVLSHLYCVEKPKETVQEDPTKGPK